MNRNFAMTVLQTVSHLRAEACPPPRVNTTNKLQPFGHRRGTKTSMGPIRFAELAEPVLPLPRARSGVLDAHRGDGHLTHVDKGVHPSSRASAAMVTFAVRNQILLDWDQPDNDRIR